MKLVIQIPCYNEEQTLPQVLQSLPQKIDGIDEIVKIVINDGSTDNTLKIANDNGADIVISNYANIGLAKSFARGIDKALGIGADIIVNTDGDNQYKGSDIPRLIAPILTKKADIVIGNRHPAELKHFSPLKQIFQKIGNIFISKLIGIKIPDAVCGFRAYSREAALRINVYSSFSYTVESLLNAALRGSKIEFIDIEVNKTLRPSRLAAGISEFVMRQGITILRTFIINRPFFTFGTIGTILAIPGIALGVRFLFHFFNGRGEGYVQSLILTAILIICSFLCFILAIAMDLIAYNRKVLDEQIYFLKKTHFDNRKD